MPKYTITYFNPDGQEKEITIKADDEAAALGLVLDEYEDDIAHGAPFVVERVAAPARRTVALKPEAKSEINPQIAALLETVTQCKAAS